MRTVAILPVRSFAEAKRRLRAQLEPAAVRALAEAMFVDVLHALRRTQAVEEIVVVTADHGAQRIAAGYGFAAIADRQHGHNPAAQLGLREAQARVAERALLVPGDCPALDPRELDALLARPTEARSAVIVPDRHGTGTNALLLRPPDALAPSFGPESRDRHLAAARGAGVEAEVVQLPSLALDVDTPDDLQALQDHLASTHGTAPHTRGMLNQLMRSRV